MDKIMKIKNKVRINEWSEMVKDCRSSGLTVQQWCAANGINIKTYYYRYIYKCLECEKQTDEANIIKPEVPVPVMKKSTLIVNLLTLLLYQGLQQK